jgi:hypothetical protein
MDIYQELAQLVASLNKAGVPYALCGGLALAVHGLVRATEDIDLLVEEPDLLQIRTEAERLGFRLTPTPFEFKGGQVKIHRMIKPAGEDLLVLDLLIVTPATQSAWETRYRSETEFGPITVISPTGLIYLKTLLGSGQDLDDIRRLKELPDET